MNKQECDAEAGFSGSPCLHRSNLQLFFFFFLIAGFDLWQRVRTRRDTPGSRERPLTSSSFPEETRSQHVDWITRHFIKRSLSDGVAPYRFRSTRHALGSGVSFLFFTPVCALFQDSIWSTRCSTVVTSFRTGKIFLQGSDKHLVSTPTACLCLFLYRVGVERKTFLKYSVTNKTRENTQQRDGVMTRAYSSQPFFAKNCTS